MTEFHPDGIATLNHWGLIRAQGDDAVKFLHGQLTHDLVLLPVGRARLAAYCSPKGRMLASFVAIKRAEDEVWLLGMRDLLPAVMKRLQMFVMRAKVRLTDESTRFTIHGLMGSACEMPATEPTPWHAWGSAGNAHVVALYPTQGVARQLRVLEADDPNVQQATLERNAWDCGEILSGVGMVQAATSELFVPQMLNYESVGGVSFKKGCYPGQEVVARSQFRGTLKRRTYLARCSAPLNPGDELVMREDPTQSAGTVVCSAPLVGTAQWVALLCLQTQFDQHSLATAQSPQAEITLMPLPYALLDDI